jgi:glycosyltransferase involved in cell wall biosynthesis
MKLLMISTDKNLLRKISDVSLRQIEFAKGLEELHIIVFSNNKDLVFGEDISDLSRKEVLNVELAPNVRVYPTRSKSKWLYVNNAKKLGRTIISAHGITNITTQDPFLTGMVGVYLKNMFSTKLEIQLHTDIGSPYFPRTIRNKIMKRMADSYLLQADHVRAVSERVKKYLVGLLGISESLIEVRPIVVDVDKIKNTLVTVDLHSKYVNFSQIVLMASRLEKEKDIQLAISAWPIVLQTFPKALLLIVGKGSEQQRLQALASSLGVGGSVRFEDWVHHATLYSYYKTVDVFLNTSFYEGYGMTLVEAQAAGSKVVSTDVGVASEIGASIVAWTPEDVARGIIDALK